MYEIKPTPRVSIGSKNAEVKRRHEKDEKELNKKEQEKHYQHKEKMHSEVLKSQKIAAELAEVNANGVIDAISKIEQGISGLELTVPELFNGDNIAESLDSNSKNIEGLLKDLVGNVSKIKLENKELDLAPYIRSLSEILTKNTKSIKSELDKLNQSVSKIKLETEQPIEWVFSVSAHKVGEAYDIKALAYFGDED